MEQRSNEWFLARKGKFTASKIGCLLSTGKKKDQVFSDTALSYIRETLAEILTSDKAFIEFNSAYSFENAATRWGNDYEDEARCRFSDRTGIAVEECGFFKHSNYSGGSPDGLTSDNGLIEIKCPFTQKNHIDFLMCANSEDLKSTNKDYYYQIQANMLFTGLSHAYFISYDPRLSSIANVRIIKIDRDDATIKLISERIKLAEQELLKMIQTIQNNIK